MSELLVTKAEILDQVGPFLSGSDFPASVMSQVASGLIDRYDEPWRAHHAVPHIGQMASFLLAHVDKLDNPRRAFWGVIGHDSVYIPQLYSPSLEPGLNEELSAQLTQQNLEPYLPSTEVEQIVSDIRATADHRLGDGSQDRAYLLDADMSILGSVPDQFDKYDEGVMREFSFVDKSAFYAARTTILKGFLEQSYLFITDAARELFEYQARKNIERKIAEYSRL